MNDVAPKHQPSVETHDQSHTRTRQTGAKLGQFMALTIAGLTSIAQTPASGLANRKSTDSTVGEARRVQAHRAPRASTTSPTHAMNAKFDPRGKFAGIQQGQIGKGRNRGQRNGWENRHIDISARRCVLLHNLKRVLQHIRDYEPNASDRMEACRYANMHHELPQNRTRNPPIEAGTHDTSSEPPNNEP